MKSIIVSVKHVDVYLSMYSCYSSVGAELPIYQSDVWFILSISCNPNLVVMFQIGSLWQIAIYESLADVKNRLNTSCSFYNSKPSSNACKQYSSPSHFLDLTRKRFNIKNWRKIAFLNDTVFQKVSCLFGSRCYGGKEVIGSNLVTMCFCITIIFSVIWI